MEYPDWSLFSAACMAYDEDHADILKPFREHIYVHGLPWDHKTPPAASFINEANLRVLLRSMASTFETNAELRGLFNTMDDIKTHHFAWAAASDQAGDVLMARAKGRRPSPPLPGGWDDTARFARTRGRTSSAAFWAGQMLDSAHLPRDLGEGQRGVA